MMRLMKDGASSIDEVGRILLDGYYYSPSTFLAVIFVRQLRAVFCWNLTSHLQGMLLWRTWEQRASNSCHCRVRNFVMLRDGTHRAVHMWWIPGRLMLTMVPQSCFRGTLIQIEVVDASVIPGPNPSNKNLRSCHQPSSRTSPRPLSVPTHQISLHPYVLRLSHCILLFCSCLSGQRVHRLPHHVHVFCTVNEMEVPEFVTARFYSS